MTGDDNQFYIYVTIPKYHYGINKPNHSRKVKSTTLLKFENFTRLRVDSSGASISIVIPYNSLPFGIYYRNYDTKKMNVWLRTHRNK